MADARHDFSPAAVAAARDALRRGLRGMAQFDHPELGGRGQWMAGGMTMTADPSVRDRVARLFADLSRDDDHMEPMKPMQPMKPMAPMKPIEGPSFDVPSDWGKPGSSGGQNDVKYAFYPDAARLVVERDGQRTSYDTGDRRITGVAQDQSGGSAGRLAFTTADGGTVDVSSLKTV